jgi:hypothetical protein
VISFTSYRRVNGLHVVSFDFNCTLFCFLLMEPSFSGHKAANPLANPFIGAGLEFFNDPVPRHVAEPVSRMLHRTFSGLLVGLFTLSACAGSLQDGIDAWRAGDRATAIASWRPLAEQGHPEAGLFLGYVYRRGLGVTPDDAIAARWYRLAAELGQPEAQYELALMYELGLGVPQDPNEAAHWYGLSSGQACPAELTAGGRLGDR